MSFFIGKMVLVLFLFKAFSIGLIFLLDSLGVFEIPENLNRTRLETFSPLEILLLSSLYAPILEELAFRLPLRFSKWNLTIGATGISMIFCRALVILNYEYSLLFSILFGAFVYLISKKEMLEKVSIFWSNNKLLVFYGLLLTFSFLHLKNYEITTELLIFAHIFILPRILGGILFSYIRLNSGIVLAICFHMFNNGFLRVINTILN